MEHSKKSRQKENQEEDKIHKYDKKCSLFTLESNLGIETKQTSSKVSEDERNQGGATEYKIEVPIGNNLARTRGLNLKNKVREKAVKYEL